MFNLSNQLQIILSFDYYYLNRLDFDSYRAKIQIHHESGRDSIHPKVIKTAMKLDESAKKLYALQLNILASFNEYERVRDLTFGPEFCSFIACFYHFSSLKIMTNLPLLC